MRKSSPPCSGTTTKHSDARGFFQELYHFNDDDEPYAQVSWFSIAPGHLRGGHFHTETLEMFIVLEGEVTFLRHASRQPLSIGGVQQPPIWEHFHGKQSQVFRTRVNEPHAFYSANGAKLLGFSTRHFNANDPDTYVSFEGLNDYITKNLK